MISPASHRADGIPTGPSTAGRRTGQVALAREHKDRTSGAVFPSNVAVSLLAMQWPEIKIPLTTLMRNSG
jgi:hypothetical protein